MDTPQLAQVMVGFGVSSVMLSNGLTVGYPAVTLPAMMNHNHHQTNTSSSYMPPITDEQASWIASCPQITTIIGSVLSGAILDSWGRKPVALLATLTSLFGWCLLSVGSDVWWIYWGRCVCGFGMGLGSTVTSVLLAESTSPQYRGTVTNLKNLSFSLGLTMVYTLGLISKVDWKWIGRVCCSVPGLSFLVILFFVPESQLWREAKLQNKSRVQEKQEKTLHSNTWSHFWESRGRAQVYKPLIILNVLFFMRHMSGTSVILTYTVSVVKAGGLGDDPYLLAVLVGLSRCVGGLFGSWMSGRWGRRRPVAYSGCLVSLLMMLLAYHAPIKPDHDDEQLSLMERVLLPVSIFVYVISSTLFSDIPRSMLSELFPTDVRGVATAFGSCVIYISAFISLKIYPGMMSALGRSGTFTAFAIFSTTTTLWAILFLPETQAKTFQQIEAIFAGEKPEKQQVEEELQVIMTPSNRVDSEEEEDKLNVDNTQSNNSNLDR